MHTLKIRTFECIFSTDITIYKMTNIRFLRNRAFLIVRLHCRVVDAPVVYNDGLRAAAVSGGGARATVGGLEVLGLAVPEKIQMSSTGDLTLTGHLFVSLLLSSGAAILSVCMTNTFFTT